MEFLDALGKAWAMDSPSIVIVISFFLFGTLVLRFFAGPIIALGTKFVDEVAKPLVPVMAHSIEVSEIHNRAMEGQSRAMQQLINSVLDNNRDSRELFEERLLQEKRERDIQVKSVQERGDAQVKAVQERGDAQVAALREKIKDLEHERDKLRAENTRLKEEVEKLKVRLKATEDKKK